MDTIVRPSRAALYYSATTLVAYALMVIGLERALGGGGVTALVVLPPLGVACTVMLVWIFRVDRVALVLAGAVGSTAWVIAGWSISPATLYAVGLSCGTVPGVLWWRWQSRSERPARVDLAFVGAGVLVASLAAVGMPGWTHPAAIAACAALVSAILAAGVIAEGLAQFRSDRRRRSQPARPKLARLCRHLLALAGLVAAAAHVANMAGSAWAVLAVPTLVAVLAAIAVVRRASVDESLPPMVVPALCVVPPLTFIAITMELIRPLSTQELGWLRVFVAVLLIALAAHAVNAWKRSRTRARGN